MADIFAFFADCISKILSFELPIGISVGALIFSAWSLLLGKKIITFIFDRDTQFLGGASK